MKLSLDTAMGCVTYEGGLNFSYEEERDLITINGLNFTGEFFRALSSGLPIGAIFRLISRDDGVVGIERLHGDEHDLEILESAEMQANFEALTHAEKKSEE